MFHWLFQENNIVMENILEFQFVSSKMIKIIVREEDIFIVEIIMQKKRRNRQDRGWFFLNFYFKIKIHIFWKFEFFRHNGYYEVLGLPSESAAKISDIKHAYLRIAMKHHPDKAGADNVESKEIFEEASEAYRYKKFIKSIIHFLFLNIIFCLFLL